MFGKLRRGFFNPWKPKFNAFALEGAGAKRHISRLFYKDIE